MKYDVTHTRPFNLSHAKDGAPFCTTIGNEIDIYTFIGNFSRFPLIGQHNITGEAFNWSNEGLCLQITQNSDYDLVMLPIGICEGLPVFIGDFLYPKRSDEGFSMSYWLDVDEEISEMSWKPFIEKEAIPVLTNIQLFEQYYKYEKICCIAENENFYTTLYNNIPKHIALSIWQAAIASTNV